MTTTGSSTLPAPGFSPNICNAIQKGSCCGIRPRAENPHFTSFFYNNISPAQSIEPNTSWEGAL